MAALADAASPQTAATVATGGDRAREIEERAAGARREASALIADLGLEFDVRSDLALAVGVLTGGQVEVSPNLVGDSGERLAGALDWSAAGPRIRVEAYDPPVRQRFSLGHELGHFLLHAAGGQQTRRQCPHPSVEAAHLDGGESGRTFPGGEEREADAFAAAFLIPTGDLTDDLKSFGECAAFLAQRYVVSELTMRQRLRQLRGAE